MFLRFFAFFFFIINKNFFWNRKWQMHSKTWFVWKIQWIRLKNELTTLITKEEIVPYCSQKCYDITSRYTFFLAGRTKMVNFLTWGINYFKISDTNWMKLSENMYATIILIFREIERNKIISFWVLIFWMIF